LSDFSPSTHLPTLNDFQEHMRGKSTLSPSSQTSIWAEGCLIETPSVRVPLTVSSRWLNHCWSACVGCPSVEPRMESSSPFFAVQMRRGERVLGCSENLMKRPLYLSTGSPPATIALHMLQLSGHAFRTLTISVGSS